MESCSEAHNTIQKKTIVRMPKPIGLSTSKTSKNSKCFCSLWESKPEVSGFKWWNTDSPSSVVEDSLDHFGVKNAREREKELYFTMRWVLGFPEEQEKKWISSLLPGLFHGFYSMFKVEEAPGAVSRTKDLFLPEQSSFCQVLFWFFSGTYTYKLDRQVTACKVVVTHAAID